MRLQTIFLAMALGLPALTVRADTFSFSYDQEAYDAGPNHETLFTGASGILTTTNTEVNGALLITGISGSRTNNFFQGNVLDPAPTYSITGILPASPSTPWDNLLYPNSSTYLDVQGFAYILNCPNTACGSFGTGISVLAGSDGFYFENGTDALRGATMRFTLTQVPEPKTFPTLGIAALAAILCGARLKAARRPISKRIELTANFSN